MPFDSHTSKQTQTLACVRETRRKRGRREDGSVRVRRLHNSHKRRTFNGPLSQTRLETIKSNFSCSPFSLPTQPPVPFSHLHEHVYTLHFHFSLSRSQRGSHIQLKTFNRHISRVYFIPLPINRFPSHFYVL